ncbi:diadenylate cyclase CdaA [Deinococcus sp. YIM 77859]|uniref:diadenylate cyclase CdaA n=1 Tax=Deinococcus sp. YIM 77859 TaxID=1540221 RepID=UPI0005543BD7|nr:diadenylate cyclase CdaA [Deinococcus sp. YIM 77859]
MLFPGSLTVRDVLDVLLVAFLIYQGYLLVVGTRAVNVLRGILVFAGVWVLAELLGLTTLSYLLGRAGTVGLFALVVLFQPELRAALERVGRPRGRDQGASGAALQDLARAMERLAERKTGALIAIERRTPLGEYAATGVALDAKVSAPFLEALFARNAPLHDGGVIIQGSRVAAAGCLFPLQSSDGTYRRYGTRHRAAIGLSELTDAVVLVVSEERGSMRIALAGRLGPDLNGSELREQLRALVYDRADLSGELPGPRAASAAEPPTRAEISGPPERGSA